MLGGALLFSRGSKSERHLRKKINPAVTRSAVTDPANSRHLKKSLEARHLPGELGPSLVTEKKKRAVRTHTTHSKEVAGEGLVCGVYGPDVLIEC